jgi:aminoglycoside phosphotransferase (APT) family kinase protein
MQNSTIIEKALRTIDRTLRSSLMPELQSSSARLQADLISRLLQWIATREADYREQSRRRDNGLRELKNDARHLVVQDQSPLTAEGLLHTLLELTSLASRAGTEGSASAYELLRKYVALEEIFVNALDPEGGRGLDAVFLGGKVTGGGLESDSGTTISDVSLTAYLRARYPNASGILARGSRILPGGFGKETIMFDIEGSSDHSGTVVMRKDLPVSPNGMNVVEELPILQALAARTLPVPAPLWSESDNSWFGAAFIIVRGAAGVSGTDSWKTDRNALLQVMDELAIFLAKIHRIRPGDLGFASSSPKSAATATAEHLETFYALYRSRCTEINPRIEVAFAWMRANIPHDDQLPAGLVHGDIGFHNTLIAEGHIQAVLDWEYAHFGDPAEDLSYCKQFVEPLVPWQDFLRTYLNHGGYEHSENAARFYAIWRDLRNACAGIGAVGTLALTDKADIKSAASGIVFGPLFEIKALRSMVGA